MAFNPFESTEKEKQFNPFEPEINDDDNVFEAVYHGLAGAAGNVIKTAGHMLNYEGKPAYMSDEEWARRQDGSTVFGINKAIENFGREMEEKHQRNYSEPLGANSIASGIGSVVPYAVALGLTARSGRAIDPAGLGEAAGVQLGQKVAPRFGQTAARITEAVVPGLALGQRQAFPEALIEMENAQEDYIENAKAQGKYKPGVTEAEAERISRSVLEGNLGFITGTDAAQNALINSIALGQGSRGRRALQAIGIGGGINAAQEIGQQIIPKEAKGEDWSFTDPDIVASGIIGGITGGLPSAVAAAIDSRSRTADNFGENAVNDALNAGIAGAANGKEAFINAIAGQESGGDYNAVNGRTGAAGKYQIMPENWPAWAEEAGIGSDAEMTPENQEIVARFKLGQYYDKYGARDAAIAWYGGEGAINYSDEAKNRKQGNGNEPSINEYADSVMARMGAGVGRRDLRSMYADDTDQAIADMNNTPAIRLPEQRQDIDFSGRGEVEDNSALNSFNEADARRAMPRNEAADYAELTVEETDNVQQWNTPQQRTLRMPRRTGGVTYNPATAMKTPYLDRLNRQAVNRRADDLTMENQRVMQETAGRRQRFTGQGTPTFQALMQRTLAARSQRQQNLNNALRSNNLANLTARAMSGDHGARQTFDKLRPEVRSVLLNRAIDRLNVQNMDEQADEARKALKLAQEQQETKERAQREADKRELLQGAEEYLRSSYDSPAEGARAELRDAKAGINSLLQPIIDQLREGMGNGVTLAPGREDGRMVRISNNAPWYQDWHKEHKRKPTQKELEDIARDVYTGRNSYGLPGWEVNQENEAEFAQNRATLQEMDDFVDAYEQLEKKFATEPNGGRRSGTSEESNAGEVAARRQAETEQADNENTEAQAGAAEKITEPAEQAHQRIGERFNAFTTDNDNYAQGVAIDKIRHIGDNYYYGDSRNVSLYKIDDHATGQSAELDNEIAREQARIDKAVQRRREIDAERAQIAKRDSVGGYTDNMSAMQRGKIAKTLNKHLTYSDENGRPVVMSRAEHMRDVAGKGFAVTSKKMSNGKTEYRVYGNADGSGPFEIITKAEFDYYNWYRGQQQNGETEPATSLFDGNSAVSALDKYIGRKQPKQTEPQESRQSGQTREEGKNAEVEKEITEPSGQDDAQAEPADTIEGIRASLKAAGVKDEAADAIEVFLQARAATVYPDNPGRYFKEHPVAFVRGKLSAKGDERYYQAAYHGSPHVFERFDLGAIGTGEGAQAHGWGLYFAADRKIADEYRNRLSDNVKDITIGNKKYKQLQSSGIVDDKGNEPGDVEYTAAYYLGVYGNKNEALKNIEKEIENPEEYIDDYYRSVLKKAKELLENNETEVSKSEGIVFEVDVPENDVLLNENKTLDEQPENVKNTLRKMAENQVRDMNGYYNQFADAVLIADPKEVNGRDIYRYLVNVVGNARTASIMLNENGIKGITYYGGTDGRCFVIFDDKAISIINRYNQMAENGETKGAIGWDEQGKAVISLFKGNDVSTVLHETGHYFIEALGSDVEAGRATAQQKADWNKLLNYAGIKGHAEWRKLDFEGRRPAHEKLATAMEQYVMEGKAPSKELEATFARFKKWLGEVYKSVKNFLNKNKDAEPLTDDVRRAFDRMFTREASNDTNDFEQVRSEMSEYIKNLNPTSSKMNKLASTSLFLYDKLQEKRITPQQLKQLQEEASTAIGNQQSAPAQEEKTPEKPKETKAKIEDFGEKIGGARKDVYAVYKELFGKAEKLDVESVPLSKSWPEPDYEKLIENGVDERKVALFRATRDAIPAKPRSGRGASDWVYMVKTLRGYANDILNGDGEVDFDAEQKKYKNRTFNRIIGRAKLYEVAGHKYSLKGIALESHSYLAFMGERYKTPKTFWVVEQQAKASALSAFPKILAYGTSEAEAIKKFKNSYENIVAGKAKKPQVSFEIYIDSKTKGPFIGKKIRGNVIRLKEGFKSIAEAREYKAKHEDELIAQLEKIKEVPMERGDINHPRVGTDMRGGKDVTPEMFTEAFGFRGVEFGNWVENDRRQQDLNNAYDALMDMAAIINIKPKAISLNGTLGLAFGARGRGGKNAASAHYEPGFMAINLTKMNGAGSLGHEWFHALDNMFGKKSKAMYASASGNVALRQFGINNVDVAGDIRPEVVDAFAGIRRAILKSGMYNRAQKLDSVRTKDYWGTMEEMHARAFEKYLIDKLRDQGASNDYLANILTEEQWNAAAASGVNKDNTYPYPTDKEMPEIRAAFDNLFNVIEQVETDKGVMLNEEVQSYGVDDIMNVSEEYYQQALFDYPEIASSERVKNRVRNSIQGTLDFGALPEEILETASEQDVSQDKKRDTERDIQYGGTSGKIPQLSKTLGIGITRQLVNDGAISLTGKKINSLQELAEYAQVLRHPGYEKFHRVYVNKNGVIIGHETISTMMPSETRVVEGRDDNERAENANKHADMLRANKDIAKVYYIHNHPSGNPEPSLLDMDVTRDYLSQAAGDKFGGHIVLDTTQYAQIDGGGNVTYGEISDGKQIKYDVAGLPHKALGRKLLSNTVARLVKTLDDSSKTTVFFTDAKLNVRAVVQLPEGVNRLSTAGLNRYLRLKARDNYSSRALISTSDKVVYEKAKTLVQNGRLIEAILTKDRDVALSGRTEIENSGGTAEEDGTFFGETSRDRGAMRLLEENKRYINTPSQIKSASENNGEFNTDTPDIRYAATTEPAAQRSSEEVLRELQDALPNGKFEDAGNGEYTVTLPNNARIKVNIADRMVVNNHEAARARGAHGLMRGGELNIEGSWQSFKGSDVDGLLNLSRTGRAGTAYHEVMHAAMDLALTNKEQQAMVKHFNKEAQATGKTVSEAISDGYVEWKRARAQRRGTLFGKLFNKMQDMLNTLKSLFTGVENAHNVMRRVESGEVWQRSRNTLYSGDGAPKFNVSGNKISQFINIALKNADKNLRLLLGRVSDGEAKAIKDSTGYDVSGFTHVWLSEDVRHIQNRHGVKTEKVKGQIGLSEADMIEALEAIKSPNRIEKGSPTSNGEPSIRFIKQTGTGEYTVVEVVRQKNKRLAVKTMWKTASENTKEAATATLRADNSPQYTSKTDSGETASVRKNINQSSSFNQNISQQSPEVNGSNVQYSAQELTPEQKAAQAFTNTERKTTWQSAKDWVKKQRTEFYRDWIDKNDSLHGLDEAIEMTTGIKTDGDQSVYNRVQTLPATAAGMANALIEGDSNSLKALNERLKNKKLPHNVTMQMVLENINREKMDKAHPNYLKRGGFKNWIDAFGAYLGSIRLNEMLLLHDEAYQQRVKEWEANGSKGKKPEYKPYLLPKGLTQDDLESVIKNAPPEFRKAAQMYWQFNDNVLSVMEDAGLISGETHKLLNTKYKYYCPLMRDFSDTAAADNFINGLSNGGRGIGNVSSMLRRISIEGSERNVINPLESTVKAVAVMCNRAERNKVGQMAVELAQKGGLDAVIQEAEGTVADPKNCIFTVMFDGKKQAYKTTQELYGPIVGYNLPAAGFVLGVARNAARLLRAGATTSPSFIIRNLIRDTVFAGVSSKNGFMPIVDTIRGAYALAHDPRLRAEFKVAGVTQFNFYSSSEQIVKSLDEMAGGKAWKDRSAADIWRALMKYPAFASEFIESSTRMGEFMKARKKGASLEEAAQAARELTLDFSRSGVQGEKVNQIVPFFNAVLQGGDKMVRLIKQDPVGTGTKLAMYIVLPSLALWALNHDEDWYKEIDPEVKATCWLLPGGLRIPKPQEAGILFGSGIEAVLDQAFNKDPEAIGNWAKVFGGNMAPSIMPTIFLPLLEWQANYSFFRGQSITPQRLQNLPDELQYTPNTSALARTVGGVLKLSPVKIDNTIRGYTGTMGMTLVQQLDWFADEKQNMPYKKVSEWPFLRDFTVNQNIQNRSVDDFYKMLNKANEQHAGYGKKGKPTPAVQGVRKAGQLISKAQKDIRELTVNPRLSPEAKRQRIDQRKAYIKNVAEKANMRFRRFFDD